MGVDHFWRTLVDRFLTPYVNRILIDVTDRYRPWSPGRVGVDEGVKPLTLRGS